MIRGERSEMEDAMTKRDALLRVIAEMEDSIDLLKAKLLPSLTGEAEAAYQYALDLYAADMSQVHTLLSCENQEQ